MQLQYVQLITDKTNAADLSSGVFAVFTRDSILYAIAHIYATTIPSGCLSVCHTRGLYQNGWTIIEIFSLSDRPIILVFRHQGSLRKSDGFIVNWGAEYKG